MWYFLVHCSWLTLQHLCVGVEPPDRGLPSHHGIRLRAVQPICTGQQPRHSGDQGTRPAHPCSSITPEKTPLLFCPLHDIMPLSSSSLPLWGLTSLPVLTPCRRASSRFLTSEHRPGRMSRTPMRALSGPWPRCRTGPGSPAAAQTRQSSSGSGRWWSRQMGQSSCGKSEERPWRAGRLGCIPPRVSPALGSASV